MRRAGSRNCDFVGVSLRTPTRGSRFCHTPSTCCVCLVLGFLRHPNLPILDLILIVYLNIDSGVVFLSISEPEHELFPKRVCTTGSRLPCRSDRDAQRSASGARSIWRVGLQVVRPSPARCRAGIPGRNLLRLATPVCGTLDES